MTYAQGQTSRAKRSRLLGSIFARTPRDTSASSDERPELGRQTSVSSSKRSNAEVKPNGWRGVTVRHARETLAERICGRFFASSASCGITTITEVPEPEFVTAGQRLQALSGHADPAPVGQQNLAAILNASALSAAAVPADEDGAAPAEAGLTAKAA